MKSYDERLAHVRHELVCELIGLPLDEKLSFLTEVFCITEDLRHTLIDSDQDMEKSRAIMVRAREGREVLQGDSGVQDAPEGDAK